MLQIRPNCECCDVDLPPNSSNAMICSFECTYCRECVENKLRGVCPNCGGEFAKRPVRPARALAKFPASSERIHKPDACSKAVDAAFQRSIPGAAGQPHRVLANAGHFLQEDVVTHATLTRADVDCIVELLGECLEQWDDPSAWTHHLAASAERLLGGFGGKLIFLDAAQVLNVSMGDAHDLRSHAVLKQVARNGGPSLLPGYCAMAERARSEGAVCSTTELACGGATYHESELYQRYMRTIHADDTLFAALDLCPEGATRADAARAADAPRFARRRQ
jgi:hypothetical protein